MGPWEDYATPSRDMRLIIAMNVLTSLPERIEKHPELFVLGGASPPRPRKEIERLHERRPASAASNTSAATAPQRLTVADVLARKAAFEIAYNPNDCVECAGAPARAPPRWPPAHAARPPTSGPAWSSTAPGSATPAAAPVAHRHRHIFDAISVFKNTVAP